MAAAVSNIFTLHWPVWLSELNSMSRDARPCLFGPMTFDLGAMTFNLETLKNVITGAHVSIPSGSVGSTGRGVRA